MAQKKILAADDSRTIRKALDITFAKTDFQLTMVGSGQEALSSLKKEPFDILLLDHNMPAPDGYEVLKAVKNDPSVRHVQVAIMVSQQKPFDQSKGQMADAHIEKPFETQAMLELAQDLASKAVPAAAQASMALDVVLGRTPTTSAQPSAPSIPRGMETLGGQAAEEDDLELEIEIDDEPKPATAAPVKQPAARPEAFVVKPSAPQPLHATPVPAAPRPTAPEMPQGVRPSAPQMPPQALRPAAPQMPQVVRPSAPQMPPQAPRPSAPQPASSEVRPRSEALPQTPAPRIRPPQLTPSSLKPAQPPAAAQKPVSPQPQPAPQAKPVPRVEPVEERVEAARVAVTPSPTASQAASARVATGERAVESAVQKTLEKMGAKGPEVEVLAKLSKEVIERIVWEVVPELAEVIIKEHLRTHGLSKD